jgi:redox-sensitive bicupin YhaK (pirin superfamily)
MMLLEKPIVAKSFTTAQPTPASTSPSLIRSFGRSCRTSSRPIGEGTAAFSRSRNHQGFGTKSPVGTLSEWLYAEVSLAAGASAPLDPDQEERAIYVVEGELDIAGETFEGPRLLIFHPGDRITVRATHAARMMFLGGAGLEGPRYIWWNFVSSRRERIEQAKEDWKTGKFAPVPGETEFIPLPET